MRAFFTLALIALSAPAVAQDCFYVNWQGDRAYSEFAAIRLIYWDGETDYCPSQGAGTGIPYRIAECDSGESGLYSFHPSELGGTDAAFLIWRDDLYYLQCD